MTENKRFKIWKSDITGHYVPVDELKVYAFSGFEEEFSCMSFVNALNELHEENQRLKDKYERKGRYLQGTKKDIRFNCDCDKIFKEVFK